MSAQSKAALQAAGTAGKSAMNAAAGTVNAQIDTGTLDGAAYAAQLAKGIAEIKAAQQKQLEEQLKQQAKEIAAQQKAAAKANAKAEKKQEQAEQSVQAEQGARDDENAAKGQWTPWGEQSPVVGPVRSSGSTKKPSEETAAAETKEEKKGLWQKFEEWGRSELPAEQQLHEELRQKAAEAKQAQTDEKAQKVAELKALNRSQAKARAESRAARETNAGLLNKSKLNDSEKAEIYTRVNTWAENPENKSLMTALAMAKTKNRVGDLLEAGYTSQQLDEANEMLELYQKMGKGQVLKERVGGTAKGTVKTVASAGMMGADTAMQTAENAVASVKDEEYRNAVKQYNDALLKTQTMEDSNTAYTLDENGNTVQTEEYQKAWQQLNDARAVMDRKDKEIDAPVSKDTSGYKMYQSAQEDLSRSDLGLDAGTKMLKGAATSAAENIAIAAVNPALVLPVLSAQGAAGGMANSIEKEAPAVNTLSNGMAKFMAGWAINSVGVEQMLDSMGASGARNTIAAQIVQSIKNNSKLAQTNPAFYAVLMGAGDNGLQSFAETWADRAIDLATNTAEPMSLQELAAQSLQEAASGALGGAMTAVAGLGVNAGRQAAYERAQARQESQSGQTYNRTWVDYNDANQRQVRQDSIRQSAIENGKSVTITKDELSKLNKYFETDNTLSKADQAEARRKNKKIAIEVVKALLLEKFGKGNGVKFDIEGNTLVAYLYDEGIRHAVRRATPKKLAALQKADELFANATYLYSSKNDAHGKASNNERLDNWDYFYTPLTIEGDKTQTAGIRIAIKTYDNDDSNIYDMEMKKAEPLANGARQALPARLPGGVYGSASTQSVAQQIAPVNGNGGESAVTDYNAKAVEATGDNTAIGRSNGKADVTGDIAALKDILESGGDVTPDIGKMFVPNGSSEEMRLRKAENRKALAQMLGVEESEIPTTLKAAREYLAKVDASKLVMQQAQESQSSAGQDNKVQSNAADERAGSEPVLRAVPMESVPEEMQQVAREISESTGARVEYFESDNPRALGAYENGTLSLNKNLNTKEAAQQTIVHEFTHWMEGTNTYSKMRQYITDSRILQEAARAATGLNEPPQGMNWAEAWQQKILEDYAAAGIEADAEKEMIAKLCEKYLFYNEDAVNKICRENMSLAETVLDWVREMISRVRGATMEAELRHIERLYRKGIAEAKKNAAQEGGTESNIGKMETKNPPRDKRSPAEGGGKPANAAPVVDSEHSVSQENVPVKDSTTRFSLSEENKSIADQLNDSLPEIMAMESVSKIPIDERRVPYTGDRKIDEKVARDSFREQGLNAYRPELGNVELTMKGIKHSIYHGNSAAKQAAFAAVKDVIEQGKQIYTDERHKGNEFDTYTYAAPVELGYEKIGMAVVVKQTGNGGHPGYYIHEICDSKGNYIDLDENGNIIKKSASANLLPTASAAADMQENRSPVIILSQSEENVNLDSGTKFAITQEENEGTVSREEISRGRFARAAKARENGDSMLRALFVEEDIAEETMRVMETVRNESWRILRDTEESQRTAGQKVLDRSANGIAWALKREYHSSADRAGLKEQLIGLYADMEGKNITMEEAVGRAREIGRELVQTARPERRANTELMDAYGDAYQSLTGQVIRITDSEMQSILHRWGSLREFRRDTGNKIRVSTEDGVPIDALWGKLSETNPGKFEADTNDGDRVDAIANFVNELRPQEVQRYAGVEQETAEEIGERIIDGFVDGKVRTEKARVRKEVQKEIRRQVKKGVERLNADNYEYRQELGKEKKKIERMAERMGRKLARPTKQQHIVADADVQRVVQSIADDALAIVTGRFAGEDKLPYVGRKLVALSNSLKNLATTDHRYAGFMTVDADGNTVPVDFVRNLNEIAKKMEEIHKENPSISDLDLETARELRETLERVEHELETADKLLSNTIGAEHRESVEKTAKQIYKEIDGARKVSTNSKSVGAKLLRALDDKNVGYALTILNPMRVARMMTNYSKNSAFVEVVDALNKGQRKMMLLKGQASAIFADVTNSQFTLGFDKNARRSKTGLGYTKADYDGFSGRNAQRLDVGFRDADTGEVVYITPAMRAELAMHLMNPHNRDRVLYGGLMIPDAEALCKGKTEEAQRLSHYVRFDISDPAAAYEIVAKVVDGMSDYENQWVKAAQRYFWDFSGKEYNKTTVQLWGYEAANVANYYPAASDDKNLHKNVAQRSQENYTVENNSNLKDRVYDATKPIALNEINRTTLKSIDTMSRFCGLALPMRDFEKIYNYNSEFTASGSSENIKSAMNRVWNGKAGIYWEKVLEDMNGGRSKMKDALSRFFAKARGNYATAVLYGNASTAMKQAASFPTAAAAIGWKPLADGLANYNKEGAKTLEEINKRVATYSMRNGDGNSVYDTGDTSGAVARLVNSMPGAGWITAADDLTVKVLSTAAKAYVDENIGNLQKGSTEYWDKVADVYADCIELTQPNNGTMQLSALSRSQNEILRGVTMFSNQRIQNLGLMWDAVADLRAQKARLKDAPNDADAKAEFNRAKVKFANTMSAMAVQSLMIGLMTAAGRALWHREDEYRDELGEITSKSLWKKIADDSLDSFMSNFIGIADIVDVGRFFVDKDYTHYDFAVPELEMINGLVTKGRNMVVALTAARENDDPEKADDLDKKMKKSVLAFVEQAGQSLGVPLVNLRKNVLGVFNGVRGIAEGNGWFGEYQYTAKNVRSMISGYMDGRYDLAGANEMLEKYCVSKYGKTFGNMEKSERDKAASDMREQIAKDWKDLYVQATDEERAELAEKLGDIRVGDRKLFTSKAMQAWADSAEKTAQEKATKERADRLYADAVDGLAGQRLYKNMGEDARADFESGLNEAAKTAAKLEVGYMKTEDLKAGERYLWNYAGKNADKWLALKAKYAAVNQKAKGGADGTVKMEDFLRALESSGYSTEEQGALLQAKGGNGKLEKAKAETRISYYRAQVYGDTNGNGSLSQSEFKNYVAKSGMSRSTADEIWNMLWAPGENGSSSPYR